MVKRIAGVFVLLAAIAVAQTSTLDGTVSDPQGSPIAGAQVVVANSDNGQTFKAATDARGQWVITAMPAGNYVVSIVAPGFRTVNVQDVKMDAGVPATVIARLEIGK